MEVGTLEKRDAMRAKSSTRRRYSAGKVLALNEEMILCEERLLHEETMIFCHKKNGEGSPHTRQPPQFEGGT